VFQSFAPYVPSNEQLEDIVRSFTKGGSVLIVAPDEKDVVRIISSLTNTFDECIAPFKLWTA
jgi:hypothetical protein